MKTKIYKQSEVNLHTHSKYCGHGIGEISDYVDYARNNTNLKVLGLSEHAPSPVDRWPESGIPENALIPFSEAVDTEKAKSQDIIILKGMECDWNPSSTSFYKDEILGRLNFNYLIGSCHYYVNTPPVNDRKYSLYLYAKQDKNIIYQYAKIYTETLRTGLFLFGAHPDIYLSSYLTWDADAASVAKDILQCASELNLPLEINGNGFRKALVETPSGKRRPYPVDEFWEMASEYNIRVTINSDAHRPQDVNASYSECEAFAKSKKLKIVKWETDGKGFIRAL